MKEILLLKIDELVSIIKRYPDLILRYSDNDLDISDCAKSRGGGFWQSTRTIEVPKYRYFDGERRKSLPPMKILFSMAHEFGHYLSYKDGYWNDELIEACGKDENSDLTYNEEIRAWQNAEKVIQNLGIFDQVYESFLRFKDQNLLGYSK